MSVLAPFTTRIKTNLDDVLQMTQMINGIMMTGDNRANQIIVELYNSSGRVHLDPEPFQSGSSKIVGYFIRGDGYTVEVDGDLNSVGDPMIVIPRAAYESTGALSIAIRILDGKHTYVDPVTGEEVIDWDNKMVVAALSCFVQNTETNSIIDPDHHIPDIQELLAYIDLLNEQYSVISQAEGLRVIAEAGRVSAEDSRETAETAREAAEGIRQSTFTTNETQRASDFATAEGTRQSTFTANETQRASDFATAETAREARVDAVTTKINNLTVVAQELAYGSQPTATISEVDNHKHILFGLVTGQRGASLSNITYNADNTANFIFEDGTTYVTPPIKGEKGDPGAGSFSVNYNTSTDSIDIQIVDV